MANPIGRGNVINNEQELKEDHKGITAHKVMDGEAIMTNSLKRKLREDRQTNRKKLKTNIELDDVTIPFIDQSDMKWCDYCINHHLYFETINDKESKRVCNCSCVRSEHVVPDSRFIQKDELTQKGYILIPYRSYFNTIVINPKNGKYELAKYSENWIELKHNGSKLNIQSHNNIDVYYSTKTHCVLPGFRKRRKKNNDSFKICESE